jgi:predicted nuclease with RNAse H fold
MLRALLDKPKNVVAIARIPVMEAFVGIDVAFAKGKVSPLCVCTCEGGRLAPFPIHQSVLPGIPRGEGNRKSIDPAVVAAFALKVVEYLRAVEKCLGLEIRRIAIDAPSAPKADGLLRRMAEKALDCERIPCFTTPSVTEFANKRRQVEKHLGSGGSENRIPNANQLWMLVGFELFRGLEKEWECMEVYPQAAMKVLGAASIHKSKSDGARQQLRAVAQYTGWPEPFTDRYPSAIRELIRAPIHDAVDAYTCAWIASLGLEARIPLGSPPNDVIWVPKPRGPRKAV